MSTTYKFYVGGDNIGTSASDKNRLKKICKAFEKKGHKVKYCGVSPNFPNKVKNYGYSGKKNEVIVNVVGGWCAGTICDTLSVTPYGFGTWFKTSILKKGHIMFIGVTKPEGACAPLDKISYLTRAGDDTFSPKGFNGIKNPSKIFTKYGGMYTYGSTTEIINNINNWNFKGASVLGGAGDLDGTYDDRDNQEGDSTTSYGYDINKPFQCYFKVTYSKYNKSKKKTVHTKDLYINFTEAAPDVDTKWSNLDDAGNEIKPVFKNNWHGKIRIDLLNKVLGVEGYYEDKDKIKALEKYEFFIKKITLEHNPLTLIDDKDTKDTDESKLYDIAKDQSSYKMRLFSLGFFNGDLINDTTLGLSGKTLLESIKTLNEKSKYTNKIKYSPNRNDDTIIFQKEYDTGEIVEEFNEGLHGTIIGKNNVKLNLVKDMLNTSVLIYKKKIRNNSNTKEYEKYYQARTLNLDNILRYSEHSNVTNSDIINSKVEALQYSINDYNSHYVTRPSLDITVEGLPSAELNDWVRLKMNDDFLTGIYKICSKSINVDIGKRPMVQTTYGLNDIAFNLKIIKNLAKQRKDLIRKPLELHQGISYEQENTLEWR